MRFEMADLFEIITIIAGGIHQALGIRIVQILPPQVEEQGAVLHLRHELLDTPHQALGVLVLRVGGEGKSCKGVDPVHDARGFFRGAHHIEEGFGSMSGLSLLRTPSNEATCSSTLSNALLQFRAVEAGEEFAEVPFLDRVGVDRIRHNSKSPYKIFLPQSQMLSYRQKMYF